MYLSWLTPLLTHASGGRQLGELTPDRTAKPTRQNSYLRLGLLPEKKPDISFLQISLCDQRKHCFIQFIQNVIKCLSSPFFILQCVRILQVYSSTENLGTHKETIRSCVKILLCSVDAWSLFGSLCGRQTGSYYQRLKEKVSFLNQRFREANL